MRLRTLGRALLRRWYAAIAGLLVVGGLCVYVYGAVPVDYKSAGSVVLLPSADAVGVGGNPYLFLGGLSQAMDVLTRRLSAPETSDRLTQGHPMASYTAAPDVTSGSSIMVVTVKSRSSADVAAVMQVVLADVPTELTAMQDQLKVPAPSRIASMQVAQPTAPVVDSKPRLQALGASAAIGLLVVLLLTSFLDGLLVRVARRRAVRRVAARELEEARELEDARDLEVARDREEAFADGHPPKLVSVPSSVSERDPDDIQAGVEPPRRQRWVFGDRR